MNVKFAIIACLCIVASIAAGFLFLSIWAKADLGQLPPENYTATRMYPLKTRILSFARENNRLPISLSELPPYEGFNNTTKDIWGNDIMYIVNGTTVSLVSYGKDQILGGVGDNYDVVGIFETKALDGSWILISLDTVWKKEPLSEKKQKSPHNKSPS